MEKLVHGFRNRDSVQKPMRFICSKNLFGNWFVRESSLSTTKVPPYWLFFFSNVCTTHSKHLVTKPKHKIHPAPNPGSSGDWAAQPNKTSLLGVQEILAGSAWHAYWASLSVQTPDTCNKNNLPCRAGNSDDLDLTLPAWLCRKVLWSFFLQRLHTRVVLIYMDVNQIDFFTAMPSNVPFEIEIPHKRYFKRY